MELRINAELIGPGAEIAEGGLGRLLHYIAQLAGQSQLAFAVHHWHFSCKGLASHLSKGQPGCYPYPVLFVHLTLLITGHTQIPVQIAYIHTGTLNLTFDDFGGNLAANRAEAAFQVTHSGFPD